MGRSDFYAVDADPEWVRLVWDRFDTWRDLSGVVRGTRIHQGSVAFFDRQEGILSEVPKIRSYAEVTASPRRGSTLADMAFSVDPSDHFAAQAIVSTVNGGTGINLEQKCYVYDLHWARDEENVQLENGIPLGSYIPRPGHARRAVRLADLMAARTCADVWAKSDSAESLADAEDDG